MTIRHDNECAFCYHSVTFGKLCATCNADWHASNKIAKAQKSADPEYYGIAHESYDEQNEYIEEFFARDRMHSKPKGQAKLRLEVTQSICKELGCDPMHTGDA